MRLVSSSVIVSLCLSVAACSQTPSDSASSSNQAAAVAGSQTAASNSTEVADSTAERRGNPPVIKGIHLGMTMGELQQVWEKTLRPIIHAGKDANENLPFVIAPLAELQKKGDGDGSSAEFDPCFAEANAQGPGHALLVSRLLTTAAPNMWDKIFGGCQLWVHADTSERVDAFFVSDRMADILFGAKDMKRDEFWQTFINAYDIPSLQTHQDVVRGLGGSKVVALASYESPTGWRIDFKDKAFVLKAVKPTGSRFN